MKLLNSIATCILILCTTSCASISSNYVASEATSEAYGKSGKSKGVAVIAVNWGRKWGCGSFENAEIMSLGFDRFPIREVTNNTKPEIFIDGPPRLMKKPLFETYALLLEPGQYALTSFNIKVAKSVSEVGFLKANRSHLIDNNTIKAGSFDVSAGETIYIGHFFLDCQTEPMLWRYYVEGVDGFKSYTKAINQKYPFIDPSEVIIRLFKTTTMGVDYKLP